VNTDSQGWRPTAGPDVARLRAAMLKRVRLFFQEQDVLEVDTPALSGAAVSDPHIESISASLALDRTRPYFLHTSPEFCMKRLLCAAYPDIYQVCKVFRDNEAGRTHQPEFTMVEWYRLGFDLERIIRDTLDFIATTLHDKTLPGSSLQLSYREAFLQYAGCDPLTADVAILSGLAGADDSLRQSVGNDRDAWLDLLLDTKVVPRFETDRLTILRHYPISQAALARPCPTNDMLADRFEVFLGQFELANGYVELTDPDEQLRRIANDQLVRKSNGQENRPVDNAFIAAMQAGLPACAGVAAGFDRLLMIHAGTDDIRNVQTFAFEEPAE